MNRGKLIILLTIVAIFCISFYFFDVERHWFSYSESSYDPDYGVDDTTDAQRLYDKAIVSKDITICKKINLRSRGAFSIFSGVTNYELRRGCVNKYVVEYPENNNCSLIYDLQSATESKISMDSDYQSCLYQQVLALNHKENTNNCFVLKDKSDIDWCKAEFARYKNDKKLCDDVSNSTIHSECLRYFDTP